MPTKNARKNCVSCLMPFFKDPGKREHEDYCSFCFNGGKLCYEGNDVKEFQRVTKKQMIKNGMHPVKAWLVTSMIAFAPRWKK